MEFDFWRHVIEIAADHVVDAFHFVSLLDQSFCQMAPQKTGNAGLGAKCISAEYWRARSMVGRMNQIA